MIFPFLIRFAAVVAAGTVAYILYQRNARQLTPAPAHEFKKTKKCIICHKEIANKTQQYSCLGNGCLMHSVCLDLLKLEGQHECPGCRILL